MTETTFNCPRDAMMVRDLIADMMQSQVNANSAMDTGGGFGAADLWLQIGDTEYVVTVRPGRSLKKGDA